MTFDIHLETSIEPKRLLTFGDYPQALGVRGIHKLAARFAKCFFTPKGSDLSDLNYGTTLMQHFGSTGSTRDFAMLAAQAVNETVEKLREYDSQYPQDPDERLSSADLLDIIPTSEGDGVDVVVSIRNVEGSAAKFTLPLTSAVS